MYGLPAEREVERIFNMSLDLLCVVGFDGYFKRVNPALERAFGYPVPILLARPVLQFIHRADRRRAEHAHETLRRGHTLVPFEHRHVAPDGSVRWVQWTAQPVPEEGVIYGVGRDITEGRRAAQEQAALRRVATLVARGASPETVFRAVTEEVGRLLDVDRAAMVRYESGGTTVQLMAWSAGGERELLGRRMRVGGRNAATLVLESSRPVRVDYAADDASGQHAEYVRGLGLGVSVAAPINVEGCIWGVMIASARGDRRLPAGIEGRLAQFTELVATAIANAEARAELMASRRRIVAAGDEARRRIQRDLHDGAQQRLVSTLMALTLARDALGDLGGQAAELVEDALAHAKSATAELRELAHGILPAALTSGGLAAGIDALVSRVDLPVSVEVTPRRLPAELEATAYFIVAEALTNTIKHACAGRARITARADGDVLWLEIRDDGVGGAPSEGGSGLLGLRDRAAALDGELRVESRPGEGTVVTATLPIRPSVGPPSED